MAHYPVIMNPSFSYEDHLMFEQYRKDLGQDIGGRLREAQERHTERHGQAVQESLRENAEVLAGSIGASLGQLSGDIGWAVADMKDVFIGELSAFRSDFDQAMGAVTFHLEMLRDEMRQGFVHIAQILENRRKVEAKEHLQDALGFYAEGVRLKKPLWFADTLKHFNAAVDGFERNPLAHLHIGHIHHYREEQRDFARAIDHYERAFTYGEAAAVDHPIAAQGAFAAGWLHGAVNQDFPKAIHWLEEALRLDASLAGAVHYHLAKFLALSGQADPAIQHLEQSILQDRNYCVQAGSDPDFQGVTAPMHHLFEKLRGNACSLATQRFEKQEQRIRAGMSHPVWQGPDGDAVRSLQGRIRKLVDQETYFAALEALPLMDALDAALDTLDAGARTDDDNRRYVSENVSKLKELVSIKPHPKLEPIFTRISDLAGCCEKLLQTRTELFDVAEQSMRRALKEHVDLLRLNQELFEEDKRRKEVDEFQNSNSWFSSHHIDIDFLTERHGGFGQSISVFLFIMFSYCFWQRLYALMYVLRSGDGEIGTSFLIIVSYFAAMMAFPFRDDGDDGKWKTEKDGQVVYCEPSLSKISERVVNGVGLFFLSSFIGTYIGWVIIAFFTEESLRGSIFMTGTGFLAIIMPWLMVVVGHVNLQSKKEFCRKVRSMVLLKNQPKPSIPPSVDSLLSIPLPSSVMASKPEMP